MYYIETQRLFNKLEQLKKKTYLIHKLKLEYNTRQDLTILAQIVLTFSQKQLEILETKLVEYKNYNPLVRLVLTNHLKETTTLARENLYKSINPDRNRKLIGEQPNVLWGIGDDGLRFDLKINELGLVSFEPLLDKDIPDRLKT